MPSRWVIPRENVPARRRLMEVSPVISSTSSTWARGMLFVWASICRCARALRPGWMDRDSRRAPTSWRGQDMSWTWRPFTVTSPLRGASRPMMAEMLDGELRSGDSDLGEQPGRGGLVCGHGEGVAAADGRAVAPGCPREVYGPGAVRAHGTAVPLHRRAPAGPGLVKKTLHAAFGVGFPLAGGACGGDLDEFMPGRGQGGVGEA